MFASLATLMPSSRLEEWSIVSDTAERRRDDQSFLNIWMRLQCGALQKHPVQQKTPVWLDQDLNGKDPGAVFEWRKQGGGVQVERVKSQSRLQDQTQKKRKRKGIHNSVTQQAYFTVRHGFTKRNCATILQSQQENKRTQELREQLYLQPENSTSKVRNAENINSF
ncbi:uncharacterized protein V6R79_007935 [Siganus canaliculatus]